MQLLVLNAQTCLSPPALTHCIRMTSVAIKGSSSSKCARITAGHTWRNQHKPMTPTRQAPNTHQSQQSYTASYCGLRTCRPSEMLVRVERMTSAERKASGSVMRRMAESSSVRSNHCAACVFAAVCHIMNRACMRRDGTFRPKKTIACLFACEVKVQGWRGSFGTATDATGKTCLVPAEGTSGSAQGCTRAPSASGCACMPSRSIRSGSFQTAPLQHSK
jgi:hypothetical protein